jgi:hypothetical protein
VFVLVMMIGLADTFGGYRSGFGTSLTGVWLGIHTLPVMLMGLSVTAYKQLNNSIEDVTAVFE